MKFISKNKLIPVLLLLAAFNCYAKEFSIKTPNVFALKSYSPSHHSFPASQKTPQNHTLSSSVGVGPCILESTSSLLCGTVSAFPSFVCAYMTMYELYNGISKTKNLLTGTGLCIATSLLIPFGSAGGATLAGKLMHQHGSYQKAFNWAMATGLIAWGVSSIVFASYCLSINDDNRSHIPETAAISINYTFPMMVLGSVVGSVIGYNKGEDYEGF